MKRPAWPRPQSVSARPSQKEALAYVFKTLHLQHGGKLSLTRLLAGHLDDGATLQSSSGEAGRVSGILAVSGAHDSKRAAAEAGDTVALGKLDAIKTGDTLSSGKTAPPALVQVEPTPPVLAMSLAGERPQGRRQARPGAAAAERGGSVADDDPQPADP